MSINDREYWSGKKKWTIHRRRSHKKKNKNQTKTQKKPTQCALDTAIRKQTQITLIITLQTTGGKDEPTIVCMRKSQHEPQTSSHIIGEHKTLQRWATRISMTGKYFVNALCLWVQSVFINIDRNLTALINQIKTNLKKC
jgi:hypothetical protein